MGRSQKRQRYFWNILISLVGLGGCALAVLGSLMHSFLCGARVLFEGDTTCDVVFLRKRLSELRYKNQTELYYWILNPNTYFEQLIWPSKEELARRKVDASSR